MLGLCGQLRITSMTLTAPVLKPISQLQLSPGSLVTVPNISWQEFEAILEEWGERRAARVAYCRGTLEIMIPLPEHEIPRDLMSDVVKILLKRSGLRYQPFGSTTFKQLGSAGVEPDACFLYSKLSTYDWASQTSARGSTTGFSTGDRCDL